MSGAGGSGVIKESFMQDENKVDIEETSVNLDCMKKEPNEEVLDFIQDSHPTRYTIALEYENLFGEPSHQTKVEEDSNNLIGFLDNHVIMETAMVKLEAIKEEDDGSFISFYCSKCKGIYKGYCLKCSTLLHILNNNLPFTNSGSESNTTPTDILEIREESGENGVYLTRTLPINVIFGPFEGILGIESTVGHSWKIIDNKLRNIKSGNWMKNIVCAASALLKNLEVFQINGNLYFQTNREITEGEELLFYYDHGELQQLDNSEEWLYTPQKQEKLPKIFACTICCLGFGSSKCLMEHKGKCRVELSRGINDFVLVECHYCKMWMEKWEHEEHHVAYCLEKHHTMSSRYSEAVDRSDAYVEEMGDDFGRKDDKTRHQRDICSRRKDRRDKLKFDSKNYQNFSGGNQEDRLNESALAGRSSNEQVQNPIETNKKIRLQNHLNKHRGIKEYQCDICMKEFGKKGSLKMHIRSKHTDDGNAKDYKCSECSYRTNVKSNLRKHLNLHRSIKPFLCDICMMTFTQKSNLKMHIKNKHTDDGGVKDYKCSECSYQTNYKSHFQRHLNQHSGIKLFQCDICMAKFTEKCNLKRHIRYKHTDDGGVKDYNCSECFFQTKYKANFQMHLNKHKGIKPFQCDICMLKFTEKCNLKRHINLHRSIKPFQCDICMMTFTQKSNLKMHIKNKHTDDGGVKDYKCSECSYQTNYKSHFQRHLNQHKGIKPFQCDICVAKFTEKGNLKMHIKDKHRDDEGMKDYKCLECSYATTSKISFQRHLNQHSGIKLFQCDICMAKFTEKCNLKRHIRYKHTDDGGVKDYSCSECFFQTKYKANFQMHLNKHKGIKLFQCDICMSKFTEKGNLKMHIKDKHRDDESMKDYKCLECSYETTSKISFQRHLNQHSGIKPFQCDICMAKFTEKCNLKRHIRYKHTDDGGVKDYNCSECFFQTKYKANFQMHLNKHKGIKPYQCDICMSKFTEKGNLKRHIRYKHTGDGGVKDYNCSECFFQTKYRANFQMHLNKHKGIIPFQCDICMAKFTGKGSLKMHIKTKHTDNADVRHYKCLECSYATTYKISFQSHLNKHKGIKPFTCNICMKEFGQKGNLARHINTKHAKR